MRLAMATRGNTIGASMDGGFDSNQIGVSCPIDLDQGHPPGYLTICAPTISLVDGSAGAYAER